MKNKELNNNLNAKEIAIHDMEQAIEEDDLKWDRVFKNDEELLEFLKDITESEDYEDEGY